MKRLSVPIICAVIVVFTSSPVIAQISYCKDFLEPGNPGGLGTCDIIGTPCSSNADCAGGALECLGGSLKTFEDNWTLSPGETVDLDIWLNDVPEDLIIGGYYITFNPSLVNITNVMPYELNRYAE